MQESRPLCAAAVLLPLALLLGCLPGADDDDPATPDETPEPTPPPWTGPYYEDVTEEAGIAVPRDGYGVAAGDVDGDGWDDLLYAAWGQNALYLNNGDGSFRVGNAEVGLPVPDGGPTPMGATLGVALVDFDGDGDLDAFFQNFLADRVWCNAGGTLSDCGAAMGDYTTAERASGSASFADYDGDGDLDAYVTGGGESGGPGEPIVEYGAPDRLLRNDGALGFTDVSTAVGLGEELRDGVGFVAGWSDLDHDGDPDLYLVNDIGHVNPNELFRNDGPDGAGGWVFTPMTHEACGCRLQEAGMGLGIADYDRDGWQDLYTSNGARLDGPNPAAEVLLRNLGGGLFVDTSLAAGARAGGLEGRESSWGLEFLDVDNDGWPDAFVPFGSFEGPEDDALLMNRGGTFELDPDGGAGAPDWGMGVAVLDIDRDGCLDLAVNYATATGRLYRNTCGTGNRWLELELVGVQGNPAGVGAVATARVGERALREEVFAGGTSVYSSRPAIVHFGLGLAAQADEVAIAWPGGGTQTLRDVPPGRWRVVEGEATPVRRW